MSGRAVHSLPIADVGELPADQLVGLIDPDAVACLTARLAEEGLLTPIWVRRNGNAAKKPWSVIAGRHRLRAAAALGWTEIAAEERADAASDAYELRRLQVAENLDRRVLRPIERACHIMERWRAAAGTIVPSEPANRYSAAVRQRWEVLETVSNTSAGDMGTVDVATAAACGVTDRTVRSYRDLHAAIVVAFPDLFARLNAHPLGESLSAMKRLAAFKQGEARRHAIDTILSRPDWQSIDEALSAAGLARSTGSRVDPEKLGAVMMDAWGKMPLIGRRAHVEWLVENVTPGMAMDMVAGFKRRGLLAYPHRQADYQGDRVTFRRR